MQHPLILFTISELNILIKSLNNFSSQLDEDDPLETSSAAFISSILQIPYLETYLTSFNKNIFLIGNIALFAYGFYAFINLYKNYDKRELIHSNLKSIYLQIFYGLFTVIIFNIFFL